MLELRAIVERLRKLWVPGEPLPEPEYFPEIDLGRRRLLNLIGVGAAVAATAPLTKVLFLPSELPGFAGGLKYADVIALQLEAVRDQLPALFEADHNFLAGIGYYQTPAASGPCIGLSRSSFRVAMKQISDTLDAPINPKTLYVHPQQLEAWKKLAKGPTLIERAEEAVRRRFANYGKKLVTDTGLDFDETFFDEDDCA